MCDRPEYSNYFASINLFTASVDDIAELPGIGKKAAKNIIKLREIEILDLTTMRSIPGFPIHALQRNLRSGRISRMPGEPVTEPCQVQHSPRGEYHRYQRHREQEEERSQRMMEFMTQMNWKIDVRKQPDDFLEAVERDKQRYVERESTQMKEMEKVREAREKLEVENKEREHHFSQLSESKFTAGQGRGRLEKKNQISKLPEEEFSLDIVCSGGSDTSSVHQEMRDSPETKSITTHSDTINSSSNTYIQKSGTDAQPGHNNSKSLVEVNTRDVSPSDKCCVVVNDTPKNDTPKKTPEDLCEHECSHSRSSDGQQQAMSSTPTAVELPESSDAHSPNLSRISHVTEELQSPIRTVVKHGGILHKHSVDVKVTDLPTKQKDMTDSIKQEKDNGVSVNVDEQKTTARNIEEKHILELMSMHPSDSIYRGKDIQDQTSNQYT